MKLFLSSTENPDDLNVNLTRLQHVCMGNDHAKDFLISYIQFSHILDDLVDDEKPGIEKVASSLASFLSHALFNPFFEKHKSVLYPEILAGINAWCDSEIASNHDNIQVRRASDVLKSQHCDLIFLVAYYIGGYDHMREVSKLWRTFDFDQE